MPFINESGVMAMILQAGTQDLTGSIVATLFVILFFLFAVAVMFGIPLEFLSIIILPFCIALASYYSNFVLPLIILLIYIATLFTKNWIFR